MYMYIVIEKKWYKWYSGIHQCFPSVEKYHFFFKSGINLMV